MKNRARIAGHPIHPMLITIPIAAFVLSLVGDLLFLGTGVPFWYAAAFWLIIAGIIGGLAAAVPGVIDYVTSVPPAARRTARTHGLMNVAIVVLYAVNAYLRATQVLDGAMVGWTVALSVLGVAGLMVSGWLGGTLVYQHRIGVDEPAPESRPEEERRAA